RRRRWTRQRIVLPKSDRDGPGRLDETNHQQLTKGRGYEREKIYHVSLSHWEDQSAGLGCDYSTRTQSIRRGPRVHFSNGAQRLRRRTKQPNGLKKAGQHPKKARGVGGTTSGC